MTSLPKQAESLAPEMIDALLRNELAFFVRAAFAEVSPGVTLIWDEYLDLICARLGDVVSGKIRNLIITMPPRHLKSICVSVALPAFLLGHEPGADILAVSYGQELAKKFAEDTRTVMTSAFYQRIFDTRLAGVRQPIHAMKTTVGGIRRATSIDGAATGVGADLMIFDDPQKPNEVLSEAVRRATNNAYQTTFLSRRNDPATCRTVIVMQRLHEDDFVGHVLSLGGEWHQLNLPAVAEANEAHAYETFLGRHVYRRQEGAALHGARIPLTELALIRATMGEAAWASQYMQRPAPAGGGVINTAWFRRYAEADLPTALDRIIQSWDTASKIAVQSDYSVCTTWGIKDQRRYLLSVFRKRLLYPDLRREVVNLAAVHEADTVYIEDQASGTQLLQDLNRDGFAKVIGRKPMRDKQTRMVAQAAQIENGFVYIPKDAHWLAEYLHELMVFPNGKYDDQVDSTSQALDALVNPMIKGYAFLELAERENRARGARTAPPRAGPCYAQGSMEWAAQQAAIAAARGEGAQAPS